MLLFSPISLTHALELPRVISIEEGHHALGSRRSFSCRIEQEQRSTVRVCASRRARIRVDATQAFAVVVVVDARGVFEAAGSIFFSLFHRKSEKAVFSKWHLLLLLVLLPLMLLPPLLPSRWKRSRPGSPSSAPSCERTPRAEVVEVEAAAASLLRRRPMHHRRPVSRRSSSSGACSRRALCPITRRR